MIGISTLTQNSAGHLVIYEKKSSQMDDRPARVSRIKTLDGGVYINHSGVAAGDRTLNVVVRLSDADRERLLTIYETETFVRVSFPDGMFTAVISSVRRQNADTLITLMLNEKESS